MYSKVFIGAILVLFISQHVIHAALVRAGSSTNLRPIIGILTQPTDGPMSKYGHSYIAASYVKYLEMSGVRVAPVFHNSSKAELKAIFSSLNGVLFPGGGSDLNGTPLFHAAQYLYDLAVEANSKGDYFPIFGHCMGFELLNLITSGNPHLLTSFDAENISMALSFTNNAKSSRLFGNAAQSMINIFSNAKNPVTMNNHMWGVSPSGFNNNANLTRFYNVLSNNVDRKGNTFISTIEGKTVPIYGLQWHPEKNPFEWNPLAGINHTPDGIIATQYVADFFGNEARKSHHSFPSASAEQQALIYNYNPVFTAHIEPSFVQCYIF